MSLFPGVIHIHSDYSHDGHDSLEVLRTTCLERGIRFVGMTDHAEDLTPEIFEEYQQHCASVSDAEIQFIPGLEFRFAGLRGLHLLALNLRKWITPHTPEEFFEQTAGVAQFTVLAHPVLARYQIPQVVLDKIGAIEVWNANYNTRYLPDPKSMRILHELRRRRPEVVATVGLDQHDSSNDRELRIVLPEPNGDPVAEIQAARFTNLGRTMHFDAHASFSPGRMRRLQIVRGLYDVVERIQDRTVRTLRRLGVDPR